MPIRATPDDAKPTHDIMLQDRNGVQIGLKLCDASGKPKRTFTRTPIERTALKTTSGNSQYSDLDYPYSPIVQDDWSGGRGNLDFERDGTRFYDSFRLRTSRLNKTFLGPQEQYTSGNRSQDQNVPGDVTFIQLTDTSLYIAKRFQASATYTAAIQWLIARRKGAPANLTIGIYTDGAGVPGSVIGSPLSIASARMTDTISEWLDETISTALTLSTFYWIVVYANASDTQNSHWEIAAKAAVGTTYQSTNGSSWSIASFDLYFRLTPANSALSALFFDYKEQEYALVSGATGAPDVYMHGDRGAADDNTGQLNRLKDATKNWTTDQWKGGVVKITDGPGKSEKQPYRLITGNDATNLTVSPDWTITHTISTEYVILGTPTWRKITGHGLTAPITDVLVSTTGVIYCAMGNAVTVRALRAYNNAGVWVDFDDATCHADETATTKADFFTYRPQAKVIVLGSNADATGDVSVLMMSNASVPAWGIVLTWAAAVLVGSRYKRMTHLEVYPDDSGNEAVWVGKTDRPWIIPGTGNAYPLALKEMESVKSETNFINSLVHNVYLYFPLGNGLERYYRGQLDDVGVNLGEGLPVTRQGVMILFAGYPGSFFAAIDAGPTGYSSVMMRDSNGWHEHYRAPYGQRILGMGFQTVPGSTLDRLWIWVGNDFLWLPFPSGDTNELTDPAYLHTHEGVLEMSRMHAGMFDVQKVVKIIKLWSDQLSPGVSWINVEYRLDSDTDYVPFEFDFDISPKAQFDLSQHFGISGKRLQFRLRLNTSLATSSPVLLAVIIEAVMRISVKYMYSMTFQLIDRARNLDHTNDEQPDAFAKLAQLDKWAGEESEGMLLMRSRSKLYDNRLVFLNPVQVQQLKLSRAGRPKSRNAMVCTASLQDA